MDVTIVICRWNGMIEEITAWADENKGGNHWAKLAGKILDKDTSNMSCDTIGEELANERNGYELEIETVKIKE